MSGRTAQTKSLRYQSNSSSLQLLWCGPPACALFRLRPLAVALCVLLAMGLLAASVRAESDVTLRGTITDDSTGNPIDQAIVRIDGLPLHATSESDGSFEFRAVPLGTWAVTIERIGYATRRLEGVDVVEGYTRSLYIALKPDPVTLNSQSIESNRLDAEGVRRVELTADVVGSRTIGEVLETIPGVRVYGSSDAPGGTRISVGGEPASRVAVMMDGLPLSGGSDGAVDLSSIPISALTAIEVQSGSQAVIAGDAAIGGVVNLITQTRAADDAIRASTSAGEWGRSRQELSLTKATSRASFSGGGEYDQRRNPYQYFDVSTDSSGRRQNSRLDERRAFLRLSGWQRSLEVLGYASRNERGAPGTVERPMLTAFTRNKNARVQSARQFGLGRRDHVTIAGWYEFSSEYYNASSERIPQHTYLREHFLGTKMSHSTSVYATDWHSDIELRHRFIHGEDFQRPAFSFGDEQRGEYSVRSRVTRQVGRLSLNAGLSWDADGENSPAWSPRLDASFRPLNSVSLGVGWGRSFRRPLLMTAFWKSDYYTQGNPDLLPERAKEWDVSARWRNRNVSIDTRYFERTIDNIIVWDLRGIPQKYTPVNLAAGEVIGREDHIGLTTSSGSLAIDYTHVFNDGRDRSGQTNYEGEILPFMPRHTHDLTVRGSHGPVAVFATCRWVSLREALRSNTNRWQEPYRAFDADLRITTSRNNPSMVIYVRADNITNEPIELLEGYPSPARTITAGLTVGLK